MRIKDHDIEGTKYKIASLTVDQVEALVLPGGEVNVVTGKNAMRTYTAPVVAASLNNAIIGNGKWFPTWPVEEDMWNADRILATLDFTELKGLYQAIIEFSGLKSEETVVPETQGEAKAAA